MQEARNTGLPVDPERRPFASTPAAQELWRRIREELQKSLQPEQFETWFRRAALVSVEDALVVLAVQNGFARDWIQNYYLEALERAVRTVLGDARRVEVRVDAELVLPRRSVAPRATRSAVEVPAARAAEATDGSELTLNSGYRFDAFVVGPCNRFAHAAAVGVSESPGKSYNPFFLHGNVGLGKTHLLQSLCRSLLERNASTRILYLSCETFINHFISSLENGELQKFRTKYRNVDVLVVDDIHLLSNKERTQEEFFHTFNALYNGGKQIVLSCDSPPKDIPSLHGRLVSRFKWGLVTEIEAPCYETRVAILKRKSRDRGYELPDDVAKLVAERVDTNIRELEGAVNKLLGFAGLTGQPVSVELARQALRDVFSSRTASPSMDDVLRLVAERFGLKPQDLQSRKRTNAVAHPRQVAMYLARKVTRLSLGEIGGFFGGRDHTTVLYGVQKVTDGVGRDASLRETVAELELSLRQPSPR